MKRLCPEGEYRDSLSDEDFWNYIYNNLTEEIDYPDLDSENPNITTPCTICGSITACGYDAEGRPMIHSIEANSDEDV